MGKMTTGWSDRVREFARQEYVLPAREHRALVRIPVGDLKPKLVAMGFPGSNANQVVSPLESEKFWGPLGLVLCSPRNQSRGKDTVLEFRFSGATRGVAQGPTASEKALAAAERLRGLFREEIQRRGGTEAFMKWVRSDEDEA